MMGGGLLGGWGMGFGAVGLLLMVLVWGGLIAGGIWLVRSLLTGIASPPTLQAGGRARAREILDRRYARGEIGREEYDLMKQALLDEIG